MENSEPNINAVQDIEENKLISGTPVRYRAMHTALEDNENSTHKIYQNNADEKTVDRDTFGRPIYVEDNQLKNS